MAKKLTKKQAQKNAEKQTRLLLNTIKEHCYKKINKALNSGAISENSDFMQDNCLLALTVLEDVSNDYKIKSSYREEAENIQKFI